MRQLLANTSKLDWIETYEKQCNKRFYGKALGDESESEVGNQSDCYPQRRNVTRCVVWWLVTRGEQKCTAQVGHAARDVRGELQGYLLRFSDLYLRNLYCSCARDYGTSGLKVWGGGESRGMRWDREVGGNLGRGGHVVLRGAGLLASRPCSHDT